MSKINPGALEVLPGRAFPLGAMVRPAGVRFAIASRRATRVWLALFDNADDTSPVHEIEYDAYKHRVGDVWSIFVEGLPGEILYAYRMDGPYAPAKGHHFDPSKYLLDPYAKAVVGDVQDGTGKCMVIDGELDWVEDRHLSTPMTQTIIYEAHVRGLTLGESSDVKQRGTYAGLVEKIPHLRELGVTAVELLPVQEMGEDRLGRCSIDGQCELRNYWGYNSISFFAPAARYASGSGHGEQVEEFRSMVAELHKAGLEVILDVVFNHTSEGNERGPTLSFRGIDNSIYYMLDENGHYMNYSGCGNTFNCNHPRVRDLILDCLRYWVAVMHVDGFRFDLASILGRNQAGDIMPNAPLVERIAEDPVLRDVKLIAEAWDAGGAYQVGSFGDIRWAEWNGRYRDEVRQFWRGDKGMKGAFATRLTGSADLYQQAGRSPLHSINFVTCHDGFTLRDLVSYNHKHNEMNGENNRDGADENYSWNCGAEGETDDDEINTLRMRMQKNYLATLFLSLGVPMILGGDELGRTQQGNNNAYCQDNEISWHDWGLLERYPDLFRFSKEIIRFRKEHPVFSRPAFFHGRSVGAYGYPDIAWLNPKGKKQKWAEEDDEALALWINGYVNRGTALFLMFNPTDRVRRFRLPRGAWSRRIDTSLASPEDIVDGDDAPTLHRRTDYVLEPRSMAVLTADTRLRGRHRDGLAENQVV